MSDDDREIDIESDVSETQFPLILHFLFFCLKKQKKSYKLINSFCIFRMIMTPIADECNKEMLVHKISHRFGKVNELLIDL